MARSERPHPLRAVPSGPNSVLGKPFPRTRDVPPPTQGGQVLTRTVMAELFVNVPPLSNHPPTRSAGAMASARPTQGPAVK